ncbi:hypothetical protein [Ruficoccus sp. ZRK36]|uniref:CAF17-like 4Fe-4S cluster assembly/insertion protein YgfZ n=1 Tax=Ruficoccus sp. ZRK36 TaxID=2866311 RepID=UPI001C73D72D|nr:hypothetical protein [Ruficoccus sp. ZRK36]QYY35822.1 hypothetical protein K0V07_16170 [Ruficoccus sp. ZRK36]
MPTPLTTKFQPAAVLRVTGEDAPDYLQSQCSNDLRNLQRGQYCYGLWLDRKGKVCADSLIFWLGPEDYLLLSYGCPADSLIAKLEENIIADEVEIEDLTETACLVVEIGLDENDVPADGIFIPVTPRPAGKSTPAAVCFAGRHSRSPDRETLWLYSLPEGLELNADPSILAYERIAAGVPLVPVDIGPGDLPQEGGLEKVAVSFNKGCYLGQEVMARLHAMGRTQRALHQIDLEKLPESLPVEILNSEGKAVGELRSAAAREGSVIGLAMLKKRALTEGTALSVVGAGAVTVRGALG